MLNSDDLSCRSRLVVAIVAALGLSVWVSGCGGNGDDGGGQKACTPGETQSCVCSNGSQGAQTCKSDGSGWSACECTSQDAGTDTGTKDTTEPADDTGSEDSGSDETDSGQSCVPRTSNCDGNVLVTCKSDGSGEVRTDCTKTNQICQIDNVRAKCVAEDGRQVCQPDSESCHSNSEAIAICDSTGSKLTVVGCAEDEYCENASCKEQVCSPGSGEVCKDGDVKKCDSRGTQYKLIEDCENRGCENGSCKPPTKCFTRVILSFDGARTFAGLADVQLPNPSYFWFNINSKGVQDADGKLDDLEIKDGNGNVLYSDDFSSGGNWCARSGALNTASISGGTATAHSDWNAFHLTNNPLDPTNGLEIGARTYWSSNTSMVKFKLSDTGPPCNTGTATTIEVTHDLRKYASNNGSPGAGIWHTSESRWVAKSSWSQPSTGWHSMTAKLDKFCGCGNGTKELGEECDDGNLQSGDGCSDTCRSE